MILVAGENLIDFIPFNKKKYTYFVGGSALNTAVTLGRLNSETYFCSQISNDFFGKIIFDYLRKNNVKTNLIKKTNQYSTIAIVSSKKKPDFNIYTKDTASINFKNYNLTQNLINKFKLAHFSSIGLALDPSGITFLKIMKQIKKNKKTIISFDPNIRAAIINSKSEFIKRFNKILQYSDIVKMSDDDLKYLTKQKYDKKIMSWIKKYSVKIFILTLGSNGSVLYTNKYKIVHKGQKIKVIDSVGAGDTFIGGIISYLDNHNFLNKNKLKDISRKNFLECIQFASKVAEKNCGKEGCNPPFLNKVTKFI